MTNNATEFLNKIIGVSPRWVSNEGEANGLVARLDLIGADHSDLRAAAKALRAAGVEASTSLGDQDGDDDGALYLWALVPGKDDVASWDTEATYVATFPENDDEGACDVEVQVGEAGGSWYLRTRDDAGGSDDAGDTAYASEEAARAAARAYAEDRDEAQPGEDAEAYLARMLSDEAGEPDQAGEWAVYWSTVGDDEHVVDRYETQAQAAAAAEIANALLKSAHPGGQLLCGYEVRRLVDGEWVAPEVAS